MHVYLHGPDVYFLNNDAWASYLSYQQDIFFTCKLNGGGAMEPICWQAAFCRSVFSFAWRLWITTEWRSLLMNEWVTRVSSTDVQGKYPLRFLLLVTPFWTCVYGGLLISYTLRRALCFHLFIWTGLLFPHESFIGLCAVHVFPRRLTVPNKASKCLNPSWPLLAYMHIWIVIKSCSSANNLE